MPAIFTTALVPGWTFVRMPLLVGARRAVAHGSNIYLSPAMFDLLKKADTADDQALVISHLRIWPVSPAEAEGVDAETLRRWAQVRGKS